MCLFVFTLCAALTAQQSLGVVASTRLDDRIAEEKRRLLHDGDARDELLRHEARHGDHREAAVLYLAQLHVELRVGQLLLRRQVLRDLVQPERGAEAVQPQRIEVQIARNIPCLLRLTHHKHIQRHSY